MRLFQCFRYEIFRIIDIDIDIDIDMEGSIH